MPRRSKKSKAAGQREQTKKNVDSSMPRTLSPIFESEPSEEIERIADCEVLCGTVHQGDVRFQYPGIQCTYISFYALTSMMMKDPLNWTEHDVDVCVNRGNDEFIQHCFEQNWEPKMLMANELPQVVCINDTMFECRCSDINIATGTLEQPLCGSTMSISLPIDDALVNCFETSNSCLLICGGQTIALAKHKNVFFIFDPHSRDENGMQHHSGNAVLVTFSSFQSFVDFIRRLLLHSLRLKASEQYELIPISITKQIEDKSKQTNGVADCIGINCSRDEDSWQRKQIKPRQCSSYEHRESLTPNLDLKHSQNQRETSTCAVGLNTINQRKRDREQREKRMSKQNRDTGNDDSRKVYMRYYMQKKRENECFRLHDNLKAVNRMRKIRSTEEGRRQNNAKSSEGMQNIRCKDEERKKHNEKEAERMRTMLHSEEGRLKHNMRSAASMQKLLSTEKGRQKHNRMSIESMQKLLSTKEGKEKHNRLSTESMQKLLSTKEGRHKHNRRSAEGMQKLLSTEEGRQKHNRRSAEGMQKLLSTEEGRQQHNSRSAEGMRKFLSTEEGRQKHKRRSAEGMRKLLSTEQGRKKHSLRSAQVRSKILSTKAGRQKLNRCTGELMNKYRHTFAGKEKNKKTACKGMRCLRKTKEYAHKENIRRTRQKVGHTFADAANKFREAIKSSSLFVCSCCQQTWFRHSVQAVASLSIKSMDAHLLDNCLTGYISVADSEWICNTCLNNLKRGKIPKLSVANGMRFIEKPVELYLNNLEERLISLRIPFMQIRALNSGGQFSLKGSVVNVPSDIEPTIQALPRLQNKSETIPVKLKRMNEFKHAVTTENVRPVAVMTALQTLLRTSQLYKDANITIDDKWSVDNSEVSGKFSSNDQSVSDSESDAFSEIDDDDNEAPVMTLLDEQTFDKNEVLSVAPGEGQKPLSLFKDPDAEYLAFPTLFCGQKRVPNSDRHVPVYYSDICKWELRCVDRRVALHVPNIFFKMKKMQIEQVCSKVHLAVRRCKTKGKSYTAGYILKDNMGESLVRLDEGYRIFKTIRNSPQYWENQKKEVFAMIRQLGLPTLFLSLSANDLQWSELIIALGKLVDKKDYTAEVERNNLSWETRARLVQSDPVTCVRHFDYRVSKFIETILKSPQSPLGVLKDFFYRVEFQQRGSPHIHMLAWIQGAPKYGENDDAEVIEYVDRVASCSVDVPEDLQKLVEFQKHKHSRTCRKAGKPVCRFGIPFPPMRKTTVIQPFVGEDRSIYEDYYITVQEHLNIEQDETFDEFLENIGLSESDYLKALQTSVTAEKVFLKRKPIECRVNPYMKDLLGVWKANHDIQYVLDAYACAMYIVSYINKSAKGMSRLMAEACREARKGNKSLKESVRHIGNKFLNAVEVSAQEAAYLILQLHVSTKSRKCEFVPTAPHTERTFLLKSKRELEAMPKDATDIEADNVIKRYARRHKALDNFCLADFISKVVSVTKILPQNSNNESQVTIETETQCNSHEDNVEDEIDEKQNVQEDQECISKLRYSITVGNHRVVLRTKPKILRYVNYNQKVDSENYYREQIMLFIPWRNEEKDLLKNHNTYHDHFKAMRENIQLKKIEYDQNSELLKKVELATETQTIDIFDDVCPNIENIEAKDSEKEPLASKMYEFYQPEYRNHAFYDLGPDIGALSYEGNSIEIVQTRLPEKDYLDLLSKLNGKQREIFTHIVHSIVNNPQDQLCLFITGGAGVGKSVLIRTLYQTLHRMCCSECGENPEDTRILLCAYTGLAAYNINGSTLHNAFCIEPNKKLKYKPLSDEKRNTLKTKYRYLTVVIIDEVSMVGSDMLSYLYLRLQEVKGNRHPFGGIHVLLVGDLFQLRPVGDSWIFANRSGDYSPLAANLWQEFFKMFELTEIMRQKDDAPFAEILNRIREGRQTERDISVLNSRSVSFKTADYQELRNELHLFPCNAAVDAHNKDVYERATSQKTEIKCTDTVLGEDSKDIKEQILAQLKGKKSNDTGNLSEVLKVAVGLCYDTTHNISVHDGICNGTPCILRKIHHIENSNPIPSCLWVEFPERSIGKETRKENTYYYSRYPEISKNWTPIWAIKRTFMFRRKAVVRQQFPLKASSGKTIHKAQGQTKSTVVIDMTSGSRPHQHYVAFSRVTSLQGLYLLNGLSGQIKVDKGVVEEMERLRKDAHIVLSYQPVSTCICDLTVVFQNVQSLRLHFPLIQNDASFTDADVICMAETRLQQSDIDSDYSIKGFLQITRNDQKETMSGMRPPHGLAMYVKSGHKILSSEALSTKQFESLAVSVLNMRSNSIYTLIAVYKAPTCSFEDFKACIQSLRRFHESEKLIIVGDFNFDVSQDRNKNFICFMRSVFPSVKILNTISTTREKTILDLCFTNCIPSNASIITCVWSYHHTLIASLC